MSLFFNCGGNSCGNNSNNCSCKPSCVCGSSGDNGGTGNNGTTGSECCCEEKCSCQTTPTCTCTCSSTGSGNGTTAVAGAATEAQPETVRALLTTVIDSCCSTDDVCRELTFTTTDLYPTGTPVVGTALNVAVTGPIAFNEVTRQKESCSCVSTGSFTIPVRITAPASCGCPNGVSQNITVIRSARLCCTANSTISSYNSAVIAASAVITAVGADTFTATVCLLFRSCLQQTMIREYSWEAYPVCTTENCNDVRKSISDPCDTFCGCTQGATTACPSC